MLTPDTRLKSAWEVSTESKSMIRNSIAASIIKQASTELSLGTERLVCRNILPSDLNLKRWQTPHLEPYRRTEYCSGNMADQRFTCIYKIIQCGSKPAVNILTIQVGMVDKIKASLDELYGLVPLLDTISQFKDKEWILHEFGDLNNIRMEGWLSVGVVIPQNAQYRIFVESSIESEGDNIVLSGLIIEPRGIIISP